MNKQFGMSRSWYSISVNGYPVDGEFGCSARAAEWFMLADILTRDPFQAH